jgi:hypothetical protein
MDLKELLGDDYKEDLTAEDISGIFERKILATGKYENKDKVDAERKRAKQEKADLENKIKSKMSDDELSKQEMEDLKAKFEALQAESREKDKRYSKTLAEANIAEARTLLEIKADDKEFAEFITNISGEDSEVSSKTSSYIMKLIKNAYEKGKGESTKKDLGEMGRMVIGKDGKAVDKDEAFVKGLVSGMQVPENTKSNFN